MLNRILLSSLMIAALTSVSPASAGVPEWLLGKRRSGSGNEIKVTGKYRGADRVRVTSRGGPFDPTLDVAAAAVRRLAELIREKGMPRFAITVDRCWKQVYGAADCTTEALMLSENAPAPKSLPNAIIMRVDDVLGVR